MSRRPRVITGLTGLLLLAAVLSGAWYAYQWNARLIRVGDIRIDPLAGINPERRYDILVWEHDLYIPGIDPDIRRMALEAAAAELKELHPNISVHFEYVDAESAHARLAEALEAGVGPDIAGLVGAPLLIAPDYQVPVTAYMSPETLEDLLPAARSTISFGDEIWVWPRWLETVIWIGREQYLGNLTTSPALSVAELLAEASGWRGRIGGHPPVAYNAYDESLLLGILIAATGKRPISAAGELLWSQTELEEAARTLFRLVESGAASKDIAELSRSRIRRFWDGQTVLIAPVNRALLHHVLSRLGELTHDTDQNTARAQTSKVRLLSAPFSGDQLTGVEGWTAGYAVFLRQEHAGDDHTRAAMVVAHHLARRIGHWDAANLLTVPAYSSGLAAWERDSGLLQEHANALITLSRHLVAPPLTLHSAQLEGEVLERILRPALPRLLQGEMQPEAFAEHLWKEIQALLALRINPAGT